MIFRLKIRSLFAIVAHSYNCLRAFFSRLDETHAHCADDVEMSFVCVHTNVSLAGRCLDCVVAKPYAVEEWRDFTDQDTRIASAEIFAIFYHKMDGNHSRKFEKRHQLFIRVHNETLSAAAVRINNPDRAALRING